MKKYTQTERAEAKQKLPKPLQDFLGSRSLTDLYVGLMKKHKLTLYEVMGISEIANNTLLGLEPESALDHTIHQEMPELSNEKTRELVADINDRIFKEAQRRIRENITTPQPQWNEEVLGPKETYVAPISDVELSKRVADEEARGGFLEELDTEVPAELDQEDAIAQLDKSPEGLANSIPGFAKQRTVSEDRLSTSRASTASSVVIPLEAGGLPQTIDKASTAPQTTPTQIIPTAQSSNAKMPEVQASSVPVKKPDPYREAVE